MSEDMMLDEPKKRKGRQPLTEEEKEARALAKVQAERDENDLYIGHAWAALSRPPVDLTNTAEVEQRVTEYAMSCRNSGTRPNPPALAAWLGITSSDLNDWLTGMGDPEQRKTAARIYQFLHQSFADMALAGKSSPQVVIFLAKNWFGYTDAQRIETASVVERRKSLDELAKEAEALPDGDIIDVQAKEVRKGKKK